MYIRKTDWALYYDDDAVDGRRMWNERRRLRVGSLEDERSQRYQPRKDQDGDNNSIGRQVIRWSVHFFFLFVRRVTSTCVCVIIATTRAATGVGEARKVGVDPLSLFVKMKKEIYGCVSTRHKAKLLSGLMRR